MTKEEKLELEKNKKEALQNGHVLVDEFQKFLDKTRKMLKSSNENRQLHALAVLTCLQRFFNDPNGLEKMCNTLQSTLSNINKKKTTYTTNTTLQ